VKKVMIGLLAMGLLAGGALAQGPEKRVDFSINLGVQTNVWRGASFNEAQGTLDMRIGFNLGRSFQISPEIMYATFYRFHFDYGFLYPGVILNFVTKNFFVGAGAVLPVVFGGGESSSGTVSPKINIGFTSGHFVVTAYMIAWTGSGINLFDMNSIGATVGYRI
jgi:hypothetical protein